MKFQDLFEIGMKRPVPNIVRPDGRVLNLGAGNSPISNTISLDLPHWNAETDSIPYDDEDVDGIIACHFLEHLRSEHVIKVLRECERVLMPGGTMTIVVPHRLGALAYQDLDHKTFFNEDTWQCLFKNDYYDKNREQPWQFHIGFSMICGLNERNLSLFTQLHKIP